MRSSRLRLLSFRDSARATRTFPRACALPWTPWRTRDKAGYPFLLFASICNEALVIFSGCERAAAARGGPETRVSSGVKPDFGGRAGTRAARVPPAALVSVKPDFEA